MNYHRRIYYNKREYTIEIQWSGSNYCVRVIGLSAFRPIPNEDLGNIEKVKTVIRSCFKDTSELSEIQKWDGNL